VLVGIMEDSFLTYLLDHIWNDLGFSMTAMTRAMALMGIKWTNKRRTRKSDRAIGLERKICLAPLLIGHLLCSLDIYLGGLSYL
jgi:hypothetical protein